MSANRPPFFEKELEYAGVSKLRVLNESNLTDMQRPIAIMPHYLRKTKEPLAVLISYTHYLQLQKLVVDAWAKDYGIE